jgi:exopolysaccharide production protein ExoQ
MSIDSTSPSPITNRLSAPISVGRLGVNARKFPISLESITVFLNVFLSTGTLFAIFMDETTMLARDNFVYDALWVSTYVLTCIWALKLAIAGINLYSPLLKLSPLLLPIFLSICWSRMPSNSALYSTFLGANALFAICLSQSWSVERFRRFITRFLNITAVISLILYVIGAPIALHVPGIDDDGGTLFVLRGVFPHKSYAGYYFALATSLNALDVVARSKKLISVLLSVTTFICLILSGSRTGQVILGSGLFVTFFIAFSGYRTAATAAKVIVFAIAAGCMLIPFYYSDLNELIGGPTLNWTGRLAIWHSAIIAARDALPLGYGYRGFFSADSSGPSAVFQQSFAYYHVPHMHNSFVEMYIYVGYFAYGIFIYVTYVSLHNLHKMANKTSKNTYIFVFLLINYFWVCSISDLGIFRHNLLATVIMFYVLVLPAGELRAVDPATRDFQPTAFLRGNSKRLML